MEINIKETADRVKGLRQTLEISPSEMAAALGMSLEEYNDCEAGNVDFSVTFLSKCASIFGVDLIELMTGDRPKLSYLSVVRSGKGLPFNRLESFSYDHLAPTFKDNMMDPFFCVAAYDPEKQKNDEIELTTHAGQEMDFVLKGKLKFIINNHTEILNVGDTVYYDSSNPHGMIAIDGEDCEFVAVLYNER